MFKFQIITPNPLQDPEVDAIQAFLKWQGIRYEVVHDFKQHAILSKGRGGVVIRFYDEDFAWGFHELIEKFNKKGYWRC